MSYTRGASSVSRLSFGLATVGLLLATASVNAATMTIATTENVSGKLSDTDLDGVGNSGGQQVDIREFDGSQLDRGVLHFSLPSAPAGKVLGAATLTLPVITEDRLGSYQIGLYHSVTQNQTARSTALYADASFARTVAGVAIANQPEGFVNTSFEVDVLAEMLAEYSLDAANPNTWFRLSFEEPPTPAGIVTTNGNNVNEFVRIADGQNGAATLTLTFVPEPASMMLLGAASALVFARRRASARG